MTAFPNNPTPPAPTPSTTDDRRQTTNDFPRLASDPPLLHPSKLFQLLEQGLVDLEELQSRLKCSAADLRESLASPEAHELLELQTSLCAMRLKLLALKAAPEAFQVLVKQMSSDKPEVCRRSAVHNLSLAGIPTSPFKARPAKPLLKKPEAPKDPEAIFNRVISILPLSPKQQKELERLDHDPAHYDFILNSQQRKLYKSALKGERLPTPPLKSEISDIKSPDPSASQPPRAA